MVGRTKYLKFNWPSIAGVPITYQKGDRVLTRDGREGVVVKYEFEDNLTLYGKDNTPSRGFFLVIVDFGNYQTKFLRHDLFGERFSNQDFK